EREIPIDVVFSSEAYGAELARHFDAAHVCLDRARALHPVSGTLVRADLPAHWMQLPPAVRVGLALRVVIVGAGSSGTTTLARALCAALGGRGGVWARTAWVAEYGREYSANLLALARARDAEATPLDVDWQEDDFVHVAVVQTRREQEAARDGGPVLVCDTDALATRVWHERYRGTASARVADVASSMPTRALYLLTDHRDVAFEDDGLRDGAHRRPWMTERFASELAQGTVPWHLVSGTQGERLDAALRHVDEVMPLWWPFAAGVEAT
ncbi:MAG: AAA family ATPase, partial [Gemmatimonadaceae bacterium]